MIEIITFFLSYLMTLPNEEVKTAGKRLASSPLDSMKVKAKRPVEGGDNVLDKPPIKKEIAKLERFKFETLREFADLHGIEIKNAATVRGLLKELLLSGFINEDICLTREDDTTTNMLSDEVEAYKNAKLEEAFNMRLRMDDIQPMVIDPTKLNDVTKTGENFKDVSTKLNEMHAGVQKDLQDLRDKAKSSEVERVINTLLASSRELMVNGVDLSGAKYNNGFELGTACKEKLLSMLTDHYKNDLNKQINVAADLVGNVGISVLNLFNASEVRALGKAPKTGSNGLMSLPVMIKTGTEKDKDTLREAISSIGGLRARDSIPKSYQRQRTAIQETIKSIEKYKSETTWVRVDLLGIRRDADPKFKVAVKKSAEMNPNWNTIGTVAIREPGVWGRISQDEVRDNILNELNLHQE